MYRTVALVSSKPMAASPGRFAFKPPTFDWTIKHTINRSETETTRAQKTAWRVPVPVA